MKNATLYYIDIRVIPYVRKQVMHEAGHHFMAGGYVPDLRTFHDADLFSSKLPGGIDKALHENFVGAQKAFDRIGLEF